MTSNKRKSTLHHREIYVQSEILIGLMQTVLRALESNPYAFEGKIKGDIITFIAFMSMRLPSMREMWRGFHENIANKIMDMTLHTKDRWESTKARMKADGALKHEDNVTYEQLKSFVDERRCTIQVKNEHHIHTEMLGVETVSPYLFDRNWVVVVSDNNANNFITSDRPTVLSWDEPDKVPLMRRNSPGFGLLGTTVILPVSRKIALIGKFEDTWQEGVVLANRETIAAINAEIASNAHEKIIAPSEKFYLLTPELKAGDGNAMLKSFLGVR
jgi:hypothetical protein